MHILIFLLIHKLQIETLYEIDSVEKIGLFMFPYEAIKCKLNRSTVKDKIWPALFMTTHIKIS